MRFPPASLLLVVACSAAEGPATTEQATITDSAGITIVQNHRPVWGEGEGWKVSAEPVLIIGAEAALGDARYIATAARLSDGSIALLTDLGGRWFNASGEFVDAFATPGEGPGELRYVRNLVALAGDTVVAGTMQKMVWYAQARFAREHLVNWDQLRALGRWTECVDYLLPDLSQVSCQHDPSIPISETNRPNRPMTRPGWTSPGPGLLRQLRRLYRIPITLDTAYALGIDIGVEQQMIELGPENHTSVVHPFHARSFLVAGGEPLRIITATNPHWEIEIRDTSGRVLQVVRRDGGRRAPTNAESHDADSVLRSPGGRLDGREPSERDKVLASLTIPDSLPGHTQLLTATSGEILSRQWTLWGSETPSRFDVFDTTGRWLGTLTVPPRFQISAVGDDFVLGIQYDRDEMPSVVVYGLQR